MARKRKEAKRIAVIDFETDPFKHGRIPAPFAAGFFDGEIYQEFWGDKCAEYLMDFILSLEDEYIIYAHNGGKFDFFYLLPWLKNPLKLINGRIVKAGIGEGKELRDSYAIIPIPLKGYQKEEIDYSTFERDKREANKADILFYLAKDCEYLFDLVSAFVSRFGPRLTIGGTAINALKELHPFIPANKSHDEMFRPFYFGGRVQAFKTGELKGAFKIFDVNSMYPSVMKNFKHPTGRGYVTAANPKILPNGDLKNFGDRPYFAHITATNRGALPMRLKEGLNFSVPFGEFFTTSHEIKVALKHRLIDIEKIHAVFVPQNMISFGEFVDKYGAEKVAAKLSGDKIAEIFSKLILNSVSPLPTQ